MNKETSFKEINLLPEPHLFYIKRSCKKWSDDDKEHKDVDFERGLLLKTQKSHHERLMHKVFFLKNLYLTWVRYKNCRKCIKTKKSVITRLRSFSEADVVIHVLTVWIATLHFVSFAMTRIFWSFMTSYVEFMLKQHNFINFLDWFLSNFRHLKVLKETNYSRILRLEISIKTAS